ncbi:hypothetical protein DIPPA_29454 [Diplonema papillatum]|nr:hypothetical protein DIPPA_29454 [Diplonema papillatum]
MNGVVAPGGSHHAYAPNTLPQQHVPEHHQAQQQQQADQRPSALPGQARDPPLGQHTQPQQHQGPAGQAYAPPAQQESQQRQPGPSVPLAQHQPQQPPLGSHVQQPQPQGQHAAPPPQQPQPQQQQQHPLPVQPAQYLSQQPQQPQQYAGPAQPAHHQAPQQQQQQQQQQPPPQGQQQYAPPAQPAQHQVQPPQQQQLPPQGQSYAPPAEHHAPRLDAQQQQLRQQQQQQHQPPPQGQQQHAPPAQPAQHQVQPPPPQQQQQQLPPQGQSYAPPAEHHAPRLDAQQQQLRQQQQQQQHQPPPQGQQQHAPPAQPAQHQVQPPPPQQQQQQLPPQGQSYAPPAEHQAPRPDAQPQQQQQQQLPPQGQPYAPPEHQAPRQQPQQQQQQRQQQQLPPQGQSYAPPAEYQAPRPDAQQQQQQLPPQGQPYAPPEHQAPHQQPQQQQPQQQQQQQQQPSLPRPFPVLGSTRALGQQPAAADAAETSAAGFAAPRPFPRPGAAAPNTLGTPLAVAAPAQAETPAAGLQAHRDRIVDRLRAYQREVYEDARDGNNIVVMPTGTGKTKIAFAIAEHVICRNRMKNRAWCKAIVFLFKTRELCKQQHKACQEELQQAGCSSRQRFVGLAEGQENLLHAVYIPSHPGVVDYLFTVGDKFYGGLQSSDIDITKFGLIVIDEAHNVRGSSSTANFMKQFYANSYDKPQILGLTATPSLRMSNFAEQCEKLCGTMHCKISTVKTEANFESMLDAAARGTPKVILQKPSELEARFADYVTDQLNRLKDFLRKFVRSVVPLADTDEKILGLLEVKGQAHEEGLMRDLKNTAQLAGRRGEAQLCAACELLCEVCKINTSSGTAAGKNHWDGHKDSLLASEVMRTNIPVQEAAMSKARQDAEEAREYLSRLVQEMTQKADSAYEKVGSKETIIIGLLKDEIQRNPNMRALIFVDTKAETEANVDRLNYLFSRDAVLSSLVAAGVTGAKTSSYVHQMRQDFEKGRRKVLVCTSIFEEGIDIAACSLVMRYFVTNQNVASIMQTRGRARMKDAAFYMLVETDAELSKVQASLNVRGMMKQVQKLCDMAIEGVRAEWWSDPVYAEKLVYYFAEENRKEYLTDIPVISIAEDGGDSTCAVIDLFVGTTPVAISENGPSDATACQNLMKKACAYLQANKLLKVFPSKGLETRRFAKFKHHSKTSATGRSYSGNIDDALQYTTRAEWNFPEIPSARLVSLAGKEYASIQRDIRENQHRQVFCRIILVREGKEQAKVSYEDNNEGRGWDTLEQAVENTALKVLKVKFGFSFVEREAPSGLNAVPETVEVGRQMVKYYTRMGSREATFVTVSSSQAANAQKPFVIDEPRSYTHGLPALSRPNGIRPPRAQSKQDRPSAFPLVFEAITTSFTTNTSNLTHTNTTNTSTNIITKAITTNLNSNANTIINCNTITTTNTNTIINCNTITTTNTNTIINCNTITTTNTSTHTPSICHRNKLQRTRLSTCIHHTRQSNNVGSHRSRQSHTIIVFHSRNTRHHTAHHCISSIPLSLLTYLNICSRQSHTISSIHRNTSSTHHHSLLSSTCHSRQRHNISSIRRNTSSIYHVRQSHTIIIMHHSHHTSSTRRRRQSHTVSSIHRNTSSIYHVRQSHTTIMHHSSTRRSRQNHTMIMHHSQHTSSTHHLQQSHNIHRNTSSIYHVRQSHTIIMHHSSTRRSRQSHSTRSMHHLQQGYSIMMHHSQHTHTSSTHHCISSIRQSHSIHRITSSTHHLRQSHTIIMRHSQRSRHHASSTCHHISSIPHKQHTYLSTSSIRSRQRHNISSIPRTTSIHHLR